MKFNQECVRDILLYLEENLLLGQKIKFNSETDNELNSKYSNDDIVYNSLYGVKKFSKYVDVDSNSASTTFFISWMLSSNMFL